MNGYKIFLDTIFSDFKMRQFNYFSYSDSESDEEPKLKRSNIIDSDDRYVDDQRWPSSLDQQLPN